MIKIPDLSDMGKNYKKLEETGENLPRGNMQCHIDWLQTCDLISVREH